jgi:hypothetical protein
MGFKAYGIIDRRQKSLSGRIVNNYESASYLFIELTIEIIAETPSYTTSKFFP